MTCSSHVSERLSPSPIFTDPLFKLVRLLAREAARADFATRCNGEADHD